MTPNKSVYDETVWGAPSIPHEIRRRRFWRRAWYAAAIASMLGCGMLGYYCADAAGEVVVAVTGVE